MRRGFTLIELLVVIAIIAILAAILFPVFAKAREKARQSSCLSNVKQLCLGTLSYVQDYDERFPGAYQMSYGITGRLSGAVDAVYTADLIYPYTKNDQIFDCPSTTVTAVVNGNYGWNVAVCPYNGPGIALGTVVAPANCYLLMDAGPYGVGAGNATNPGGSFWYIPGTAGLLGRDPTVVQPNGYAINANLQSDFGTGRHNQGVNVGFVDGHAKWLPPSTIVAEAAKPAPTATGAWSPSNP
ncbi:MAG: DUF1559 domain-containing protein [Armatimonadia bacterium]